MLASASGAASTSKTTSAAGPTQPASSVSKTHTLYNPSALTSTSVLAAPFKVGSEAISFPPASGSPSNHVKLPPEPLAVTSGTSPPKQVASGSGTEGASGVGFTVKLTSKGSPSQLSGAGPVGITM